MPALVAVAFLVIPLAGLLIRAPWGNAWAILRGSQAGEALQLSLWTSTVATAISLRGRGAAGLGAGAHRRSPGCGCCAPW